jgi:hypothetical protein
VVFAVGLGVEGFPHGWGAGDDGVDGFGAAAAEAFVVFVVAHRVGMAEDGDGSVGHQLVELAEGGEFFAGFREEEGGIEVEARVVETPAADGFQREAEGVFFGLGGGRDKDGLGRIP